MMDGVYNNGFNGSGADSADSADSARVSSSSDTGNLSSTSDTLDSLPDSAKIVANTASAVANAAIAVEIPIMKPETLVERMELETPWSPIPLMEPLERLEGLEVRPETMDRSTRPRSDSVQSVFSETVSRRHIASLEGKIRKEKKEIEGIENRLKGSLGKSNGRLLVAVCNELSKKNRMKESLEGKHKALKIHVEAKANFKPTTAQLKELAKAEGFEFNAVVCDIYNLTDRPPNRIEIEVASDAVKNFQQEKNPNFTFGSN